MLLVVLALTIYHLTVHYYRRSYKQPFWISSRYAQLETGETFQPTRIYNFPKNQKYSLKAQKGMESVLRSTINKSGSDKNVVWKSLKPLKVHPTSAPSKSLIKKAADNVKTQAVADKSKMILAWTVLHSRKPLWGIRPWSFRNCQFKNCVVTGNRSYLDHADLLIFRIRELKDNSTAHPYRDWVNPKNFSDMPPYHKPGQVWMDINQVRRESCFSGLLVSTSNIATTSTSRASNIATTSTSSSSNNTTTSTSSSSNNTTASTSSSSNIVTASTSSFSNIITTSNSSANNTVTTSRLFCYLLFAVFYCTLDCSFQLVIISGIPSLHTCR